MEDRQFETQSAPCPKCRSIMVHVTNLPHPLAPKMMKSMFVCRACNQTRTYILPSCLPAQQPDPNAAAA
jgi:hypothetical protein